MGKHAERGQGLFSLGRYSEAVAEFSRELADDPQSAYALAMRGACFINLGKQRKAESDARDALSIAPEYAFAFYILSLAHSNQNRPGPAKEAILEALRLEHSPLHLNRLAKIHFDASRFDRCLAVTEEALALDPQDASTLILRSKALAKLNRVDEARESLHAALSIEANSAEVHRELGSLILETGQAQHALGHLLEARRIDPVRHNARAALAAAYGRLFWPLSVVDRCLVAIRNWSIVQRWVASVSVSTIVMVLILIVKPRAGQPSMVLALCLVVVLNAMALSMSLERMARLAAVVRMRRELDLGWRHLLIGSGDFSGIGDVFGIAYVHGVATVIALGFTLIPELLFFFAAIGVFGWDWLCLVNRWHWLLSIWVLPVAGLSVVLPAIFGAVWLSLEPLTALTVWFGMAAASLIPLYIRTKLGATASRNSKVQEH